MAPVPLSSTSMLWKRVPMSDSPAEFGNWRDVKDPQAFIVESWSQGFMFGALFLMSVGTVVNMKRRVLLHKLILLELLLAMSHGTFCFMSFRGYGWYLAATAGLLNTSYFIHNAVAWLKIRPFFRGQQPVFSARYTAWAPRIYLCTLVLSVPALIFNIFNIFRYFNNISRLFAKVRPYEPLFRDPWWVFSCVTLFQVIQKSYSLGIWTLCKKSPRFGVMLVAMFLAIVCTIVDILATVIPGLSVTGGINPYWKLSLVFKCLTDNILLDDFKSVLQRLGAMSLDGTLNSSSQELSMTQTRTNSNFDPMSPKTSRMSSVAMVSPINRTISDDSAQITFIDLLHDRSDLALSRSHEKRRASTSNIGRLGVKIHHLPRLPFAGSSPPRKDSKQS